MKIASEKVIRRSLYITAVVILILYPLRHICVGVDLWDAGYNYGNFRYPGIEHMDSMWYFATWLANQFGTLFTKLPFADSMLGLNVYTGLLVSLLAVLSWIFAVKVLKIPAVLAFVGELMAISLCWLPTAVLYNYLTYLFLLIGTLLLYWGLTTDRYGCLVAAGVVLGCNVAVRFSNLPQMALIIAVWSYGRMCRKQFSEVLKETGFCILGYVGALGIYLLLMVSLYGLPEYVQGIFRLFGMTETAVDYSPSYMLQELLDTYYGITYWLKRFGLAVVAGLVVCTICPGKGIKIKKTGITGITLLLVVWLVKAGYCYPDYHVYASMFEPAVTVLAILLMYALYQLGNRQMSQDEKLMAVLMLITVLITSLGSNNAVYSSINNLFLVMPWFIGTSWKFFKEKKSVWYFPFQCLITAVLVLLFIQSVRFGTTFVYEEADGGRKLDTVIEEVPVLAGMKTNAGKAAALTGLYGHLQENNLLQHECLLYGRIPGVAYYMDMAPAMNIWADLDSYTYQTMEKDLIQLGEEIQSGGQKPVMILEAGVYTDIQEQLTKEVSFLEGKTDDKTRLICEWIKEFGYTNTYINEKFAVFQ